MQALITCLLLPAGVLVTDSGQLPVGNWQGGTYLIQPRMAAKMLLSPVVVVFRLTLREDRNTGMLLTRDVLRKLEFIA